MQTFLSWHFCCGSVAACSRQPDSPISQSPIVGFCGDAPPPKGCPFQSRSMRKLEEMCNPLHRGRGAFCQLISHFCQLHNLHKGLLREMPWNECLAIFLLQSVLHERSKTRFPLEWHFCNKNVTRINWFQGILHQAISRQLVSQRRKNIAREVGRKIAWCNIGCMYWWEK